MQNAAAFESRRHRITIISLGDCYATFLALPHQYTKSAIFQKPFVFHAKQVHFQTQQAKLHKKMLSGAKKFLAPKVANFPSLTPWRFFGEKNQLAGVAPNFTYSYVILSAKFNDLVLSSGKRIVWEIATPKSCSK